MKEDSRLWILIGRKLSGEATEDELKELAQLSQQYPDIPYYITILSVWWKRTEHAGKPQADKALIHFLEEIEKRKSTINDDSSDQYKDGQESKIKPVSILAKLKNYLREVFHHKGHIWIVQE